MVSPQDERWTESLSTPPNGSAGLLYTHRILAEVLIGNANPEVPRPLPFGKTGADYPTVTLTGRRLSDFPGCLALHSYVCRRRAASASAYRALPLPLLLLPHHARARVRRYKASALVPNHDVSLAACLRGSLGGRRQYRRSFCLIDVPLRILYFTPPPPQLLCRASPRLLSVSSSKGDAGCCSVLHDPLQRAHAPRKPPDGGRRRWRWRGWW